MRRPGGRSGVPAERPPLHGGHGQGPHPLGRRRPADVRTVPAPGVDPRDARAELARRYLHVLGPATPAGFGGWAGIRPAAAGATFRALAGELVPVATPVGDAWILACDEPSFASPPGRPAPVRLLPSGDAFFLLQGADRELLVPDAARRGELWTPRVWPGALVVEGEVAGTWRRAEGKPAIRPWRRLSAPSGMRSRRRPGRCRSPAITAASASRGRTRRAELPRSSSRSSRRSPWRSGAAGRARGPPVSRSGRARTRARRSRSGPRRRSRPQLASFLYRMRCGWSAAAPSSFRRNAS